MAFVRIVVVGVCVLACGLASASERVPDPRLDAVAPLFRQFCASLDRFGVDDEAEMEEGSHLVVVHAMTPDDKVDRSLTGEDYFKQEAYGVFLFDESGRYQMTIDIFGSKRWLDGMVDIIAADEASCLVRYRGASYGFDFGTRKYFYDLSALRVLNRVVYYAPDVTDMVQVGASVYFLVRDGRDRFQRPSVLLRLDSVERLGDDTAYTVTESIQGEPIPPIQRIVTDDARLLLQTEERQYAWAEGVWTVGDNPDAALFHRSNKNDLVGLNRSFRVARHVFDSWSVAAPAGQFVVVPEPQHPSGVVDISATPPHMYEIPVPDVETFREYRPSLAEWLGGRESRYEFEASIGAFQYEGGLIWFGTTFHSGEGTEGVGALGYFDTAARSFHITYNRLIAGWSCSALLLEEGALWLGLVNHPEGADWAGGLARYDREDAVFTQYGIPAVVRQIRRFDGTLFLATDDGVYTLNEDGLRHIALDFDVEGRYVVKVTEAGPSVTDDRHP